MPSALSLGIHLVTHDVHYFHMFPREDIQRGSFHRPIEDGTAVTRVAALKVSDGVFLLLLCVERF